jgi:fibronectin-binding autotransporter adhesin
MKRLTALVAASLVLAVGLTAQAQINYYFDANDDATGSGVVDGSIYPWDTTTPSWNTINADGTQASPGLNVAWANGNNAILSAGTDASGLLYAVNIAAGVTAANAEIQEGTVRVLSGIFDVGTGTITVNPNAALYSAASSQYAGGGRLTLKGTSTADAAEFKERNTASAGSMINNGSSVMKDIHIDGFGRVSYDDGDGIADNKVSIIAKNYITGEGGTPTNGGAGTLIKSGPDQVGFTTFDTGGGVWNYTLNSFKYLRVEQGGFRLRGTAGLGIDERMFGAVPLATLADAITLDGGGIGSNTTVTLDAKRGITVTANGGYLDHGAGASLVIPGPITASPGSTLTIGDPTSTSAANPGFTLSNVNNVTTFQGNLFMFRSTLTLSESLNVAHLSGNGGGALAGQFGIISIAAGKTLTAGDGVDADFDARVSGAGTFTKTGTSTLTLNPSTLAGEWTNTGGVNINGGTIKYGTSAAGFSSAATVTIASGAKLNMNGVNDSFGALSGPAGGTVDMNDGGNAATPGNLTLAAATPVNTTYSGTITGGGNLTKSSSSTQVLAGNSTLGTVAVNGGTLNNNATMTTSGGVTVAAAGTLGGTGSIAGAISNSGTIAPGNGGVGTLTTTGNFTDLAGSIWSIDLSGATADKLAVIGNIDLTAADTLNVLGTGTGSSWIIGSYTGTETGIFDTITSGYSVSYTGGNITLNAAPACAPGDANCDGNFNAQDFVLIRKANSDITTGAGLTQYNAWRAAYTGTPGSGSGGGLSAGNVPEPASLGLLFLGLAAFGFGRRGR